MFNSLLPKTAPFFELLLEQNKILCTVSNCIVDILENNKNIEHLHIQVAELEAEADELNLSISRHLSQTFITPIDREDILHINKAQEEAIDHLHNMASRLYVFEFSECAFLWCVWPKIFTA